MSFRFNRWLNYQINMATEQIILTHNSEIEKVARSMQYRFISLILLILLISASTHFELLGNRNIYFLVIWATCTFLGLVARCINYFVLITRLDFIQEVRNDAREDPQINEMINDNTSNGRRNAVLGIIRRPIMNNFSAAFY